MIDQILAEHIAVSNGTSNSNSSVVDDEHKFKSEPVKSYTDEELSVLIDSVMDSLDADNDGYVTYAEYKNPPSHIDDNDADEYDEHSDGAS